MDRRSFFRRAGEAAAAVAVTVSVPARLMATTSLTGPPGIIHQEISDGLGRWLRDRLDEAFLKQLMGDHSISNNLQEAA